MLNIRKAKVQYDQKIILNDVTLEIVPGTLNFLIGPNGAGKTSLINVLAGDKKISTGSIYNEFKKTILIPQKTSYPEGINLFDYISSVYFQSGWKWCLSQEEEQKIFDILEKINLLEKSSLLLDELSGGELQLANLGLCLLSDADLLLLDEPASNLDIINQIKILEILKNLTQKGITLIVIMHDINLAAKFGDNFIIIQREGKVISGNRKNTLTKENLSKAYNYDFKVVDVDKELFIQPHNNNNFNPL